MTLERAVVTLDQMFEPQMAYVPLSQVRSLQGLKVVDRAGVGGIQERGILGGGSPVVRGFMGELSRWQTRQDRKKLDTAAARSGT